MKKAPIFSLLRRGVTLMEAMGALAVFGIIAFAFAASNLQLQKASYRNLIHTAVDTLMQGYLNEVWSWSDALINHLINPTVPQLAAHELTPSPLGTAPLLGQKTFKTKIIQREDRVNSQKLLVQEIGFIITPVKDPANSLSKLTERDNPIIEFQKIKDIPLFEGVDIAANRSLFGWSVLTLHVRWQIEETFPSDRPDALPPGYIVSVDYYFLDPTRPSAPEEDRKIERTLSLFRAKNNS